MNTIGKISVIGMLASLAACGEAANTPAPTPTPTPSPSPSPTPVETPYDPWPNAKITGCVNTGRTGKSIAGIIGMIAVVTGTVNNGEATNQTFIVSVSANGGDFSLGSGDALVTAVPPGATRAWTAKAIVTNAYPGQKLECSVLMVNAEEVSG